MKVAMLTGSLSREGGGVYEIVRSLAAALSRDAVDVQAFGLQDAHTAADRADWGSVTCHPCRVRGPRAFGYSPELRSRLDDYSPEVVHQHGLWIYPSYAGHRWKRSGGKVHVITPQGMLEPWVLRHHRRRKRALWHAYESSHLASADCINVNSAAEMHNVRALGVKTPVCIVANGVDLAEVAAGSAEPPWDPDWAAGAKVLLYLGRLHAKKGVKELVHAWADAAGAGGNSGWRLAIVGWDQQGYGAEVQQTIDGLGLGRDVRWFGPAFGAAKRAALSRADAFILPSFSEGLPMAVLEAWSHRLPVLMTRECNLERGFEAAAALEVRPEADSIAAGLRSLWSMSQQDLAAMGGRGRSLVEQHYTWQKIAAELRSVYAWFLGSGSKPERLYL